MIPLLLALGGVLAMRHLHRRKTPPKTVPIHTTVHSKEAHITPKGAAVHGELMAKCIDPHKLEQAATAFASDGLSHHAEMLLRKAQELHNMMHGAQSIVERCRAGDQHAMALAKGIGEQARAGNRRAQVSAFFIQELSKELPKAA